MEDIQYYILGILLVIALSLLVVVSKVKKKWGKLQKH